MEIKYVIYNKAEVNEIDFNKVIETSENTLRSSLNNESIILKFYGETPSFLSGLTIYSHTEILEIINNPENGWIVN
tara:strand:- start:4614 stop:4841 length:228 start_codon:yes stop_codon:yes gene_type:complete